MTTNLPENAHGPSFPPITSVPSEGRAPRYRPPLFRRGAVLLGAVGAAGAGAFLAASLTAPTTVASASGKTGSLAAVSANKGKGGGSEGGGAQTPYGGWGRGARLGLGRLGALALLNGKVLHGTITVKISSGGYTTYDFQRGTLPAAPSSTSFSVQSADSFSQTYQLLSSTLVQASSQGLEQGDSVLVLGVVDGPNVDAKRVIDITDTKAGSGPGSWRVRHGATTTSSTTTTTA